MNTLLIIVEADSQSGPYKAVPAPKPLANPPPYRQPPPPANSSSPVLAAARPHLHHNDPSVAASAASAAAGPAATSESNPKSAGHGLLAHSSKFPVRLFLHANNNQLAKLPIDYHHFHHVSDSETTHEIERTNKKRKNRIKMKKRNLFPDFSFLLFSSTFITSPSTLISPPPPPFST